MAARLSLFDSITQGPSTFDIIEKGKGKLDYRHIGRNITYDIVKDIPPLERYWAGHIGVIPYYRTPDNIHLLPVHSEWIDKHSRTGIVTGFIGGGVDKHQTPLQGLTKELTEEVPDYSKAIMEELEQYRQYHTIILYAILPHKKKNNGKNEENGMKYYIIIFLDVTNVPIIRDMPHTFLRNTNMSQPHKCREIIEVLDVALSPSHGKNTFLTILKNDELSIGLQTYIKYLAYSGIDINRKKPFPFKECVPQQLGIYRSSPVSKKVNGPSRKPFLSTSHPKYTRKNMSETNAYNTVMRKSSLHTNSTSRTNHLIQASTRKNEKQNNKTIKN